MSNFTDTTRFSIPSTPFDSPWLALKLAPEYPVLISQPATLFTATSAALKDDLASLVLRPFQGHGESLDLARNPVRPQDMQHADGDKIDSIGLK
jgi:hypothetical protein